MGDHEARGDDFEKKAEKKLSGWGIFGSKYEDAADLFDKGANSFKLAKNCESPHSQTGSFLPNPNPPRALLRSIGVGAICGSFSCEICGSMGRWGRRVWHHPAWCGVRTGSLAADLATCRVIWRDPLMREAWLD
jgi:hypothetical protein